MIKELILKSIKFYQGFISLNLGVNCRFYPSCSQYSYIAVRKHGTVKGLWKGLKRILKCHPWHSGGIDLP